VKKTVVIGYGNSLRRDDGAGIAAARRLAREFPEAHVLTAEGLYPEIAEHIAACDLAVFLDASIRTKGVCVTRITPEHDGLGEDAHELSPAGVLGLCSVLYGRTPEEAILVEIPAFECGFGETMSAGTLRLVDCSVQLISELLLSETTPEILGFIAPTPSAD
jgi:hydrogenase maturation protease